jgi:hypothetical protein
MISVPQPDGSATLWLTAWEAGGRAATPGKRVLRLAVRHGDDRPGWRRSLVRNRVAVPPSARRDRRVWTLERRFRRYLGWVEAPPGSAAGTCSVRC